MAERIPPEKSNATTEHTADTRNPGWDKYVPEGQGRTDEQIRADVHEALRGAEGSDTSSLSVNVQDGIVTLGGKISQAEHAQVLELVRGVPSVKDVRDQSQAQS
jgi:osmotically-inducible protein OsmY